MTIRRIPSRGRDESSVLLAASDFDTSMRGITWHEVAGGRTITCGDDHDEVVLAILYGSAAIGIGEARRPLDSPSVVLLGPGRALHIEAAPGTACGLVQASVRSPTSSPSRDREPPVVRTLDPRRLAPFHAHGGVGEIGFRSLFSADDFRSSWKSVDHVSIPPGCSIGLHRNDGVEECFVFTGGSGLMRIGELVVEVGPGDVAPNRLGGAHGVANPGPAPLEFINLSVAANNGLPPATDLGDDLASLLDPSASYPQGRG